MSRHRHRARKRTATDSHPLHFSQLDMREMATERDKWLDHTNPLDCISVEVVRRCQSEAMRGAWAQMQWTWEQLEPADPILATCVERRLSALRRIPWDIVKKEGLNDAEDLLAEAQLRTLTDFANALENLDEGIAALAQASFRHFRHIQLYETELGTLRLNCTDNWNWCRDGYAGAWQWNPAATYGRTIGEPLPVAPGSIVSRLCARPIDLPAMMLCLDRKNAKAQWQVFNGRYGTPAVFAIMPQGISENMRADYIRFARQCISNAAGVLPHGSDVKTVQPGSSGPDTFARLLEVSTQELVLRATGGLMTMLTAPGAGTNTATGSAHQDAFDDLAAAEAEEIAAVLNEKLFAPVLDQWHPGQPHLVEFIMKRPDSDNAAGAVQNIVALAGAGYKTEAEQASGLTGLQLEYHEPSTPAAAPQQAALNSLRVRFAPTMLYPPARAAFEAALNSKAKKPGFVGTESRSVYAEATPLRNSGESEPPLNAGELAALRALGGGIDPAQVAADAELAAREMMAGLRGKQRRRREVARNADTANREHDCRATKIPCPLQSNSLNNEETREKIKGLAPVEIGYSEEKRTGAQWAEEAKSYFLEHFAGRQMTIGQTDYMLHIPDSVNKAKQATTGVNTQKRTEAFKNLQSVIDNAVHLKSEDAKNKPAQSKKKQALLARTATFETFGYPATINGERNLIWFNAITKKHGDRDVLFYEFGCSPIDKD